MDEGNQPVRWPIGSSGSTVGTWVRVVTAPSAGRRAYTGKVITFSLVGGVLTSTAGTKTITFYNLNEASSGTPFLVANDEVELAKTGSTFLVSDEPRGYL